jgi:hypothetical protein
MSPLPSPHTSSGGCATTAVPPCSTSARQTLIRFLQRRPQRFLLDLASALAQACPELGRVLHAASTCNQMLVSSRSGRMQGELRLHCKHAYVEHIRGRLLHFKLAFDAGRGRSKRTIGQAALAFMDIMPAHPHAAWPRGHSRLEWPFSIPLYHGCAAARGHAVRCLVSAVYHCCF